MNNFENARWGRLRTDLAKGHTQGLLGITKGAVVPKKRTDLSTEQDKRNYKIISLKLKVHRGISDLGARVYSLMWSRKKNPGLDPRVKDITARIKRYETEIEFMEKDLKSAVRKRMEKAT
ncbi:MAG TPA: hypothetical protein VL197_10255 [Nitrospirota bacterium]|nr:hypothetical protein [Nitrospirota bacterium]